MWRATIRGHRWLKAIHIVFAGAWTGVVLCALLLNLSLPRAVDAAELRVTLDAAELVAGLIPLTSVGTILTGVILCWLTQWGFFKHWPVVCQLAGAAAVILIAQIWLDPAGATLRMIAGDAGLAAVNNDVYLRSFRTVIAAAGANLSILILTSLVATVKPWGKVRRQGNEQHALPATPASI